MISQFIVIGFLGYIFLQERKQSKAKETELLNLLVARHLPEYSQCTVALKNTAEGRVQVLKAENDLAISAAVLEREAVRNRGIPVT